MPDYDDDVNRIERRFTKHDFEKNVFLASSETTIGSQCKGGSCRRCDCRGADGGRTSVLTEECGDAELVTLTILQTRSFVPRFADLQCRQVFYHYFLLEGEKKHLLLS